MICRNGTWRGWGRRRFNTLISLTALALLASVLFPCKSGAQTKTRLKHATRQASKPQRQSELLELQALMKRVAAEVPRPAKVSATRVNRNGYWEARALRIAWYGTVSRLLPTVSHGTPDLISYWVVRTEKDQGFATKIQAAVASVPELSPWAGQLQTASDALIQEDKKAEHITISGAPDKERAAMRRALHLDSKRLDLIKVIRGILGAAGRLDPEHNSAWKPLYELLKQDADTQWAAAIQERDNNESLGVELRKAFWNATQSPANATARFEKLEVINRKLTVMKERLLESALSPGQTPIAFLEGDAQGFIDSQIEFDRELAQALDSPATRADPELIKVFDGVFPVWESLSRYEGFLRAGRWSQSLDLLAEIARVVLLAESWEWTDIDVETGKSISDFVMNRAGETIDLLNKYKDSWRDRGSPRGSPRSSPHVPLYAAVEVDGQGRRISTHFGWILWKWITAGDLDDLKIDGRVTEGLGRRWLLPPASPVKTIRSLQDVQASSALQVIVGLDPAGGGQRAGKAAR